MAFPVGSHSVVVVVAAAAVVVVVGRTVEELTQSKPTVFLDLKFI